MKRTFGADLVSQLQWAAVNPNCEKDGSGRTASVAMRPFPKEVYGWYRSAMLHTGKKRIPKQVWFLLAVLVVVPVLLWYVYATMYQRTVNKHKPDGQSAPTAGTTAAVAPPAGPISVAQYYDLRQPRIPGLPHTAPAYDAVTQPVEAPYPAACLSSNMRGCSCYTQQGTQIPMAQELCRSIVDRGYFVDWASAKPSPSQQPPLPGHTPGRQLAQAQAGQAPRVMDGPMPTVELVRDTGASAWWRPFEGGR